MRVSKLNDGQAFKYRLVLGAMGLLGRARAPDVMRVLTYRPEFFGRPFSGALQEAIRGPHPLTVGERELVAAYTSARNHCVF